jgi:predicted transcriptional regulator of viral defense system
MIGAGNGTSPVAHEDVPLCADKGNLVAFIATERKVSAERRHWRKDRLDWRMTARKLALMRLKGQYSRLYRRMTTTSRPADFFARHPVFRFEEFSAAHRAAGDRSPLTTASVLKHHVAAGHLIHVRRGLYARVPEGANAASYRVDPYLVASRLSDDAVVAYHSALQLLGKAYSLSHRITYLTAHRAKPFSFQDNDFVPVLVPVSLRKLPEFGGGLRDERRQGLSVRVTGYERTMVDVLHAPQHGGGWEEIWRSLEGIEFFDLDFVVEYALRLGTALTIARVGFFLEQHKDALMVEERHIEALRRHCPSQPVYFERRHRKGGKLLSRWNLIVPEHILARSWEEVA